MAVVSCDEMARNVLPLTSPGVSIGWPKLNRCRSDSGNRVNPVTPTPARPLNTSLVIVRSPTAAATCSSDWNTNGAWSPFRLVTPAADQARAGTTPIWNVPASRRSMTAASEFGGWASAVASVWIVTVIAPPDRRSTWRLNSASGRLLGLSGGCESATLSVMGPVLAPAFAPGSADGAGPELVAQPAATVAARKIAASHRRAALIVASFER